MGGIGEANSKGRGGDRAAGEVMPGGVVSLKTDIESFRQQLKKSHDPLSEEPAAGEQLPLLKMLEELSNQSPVEAEELLGEIIEESLTSRPEASSEGLRQQELADRLITNPFTVWRHRQKGKSHFLTWSKRKDPDGIGWHYDPDAERYFPVP